MKSFLSLLAMVMFVSSIATADDLIVQPTLGNTVVPDHPPPKDVPPPKERGAAAEVQNAVCDKRDQTC